MVSSRKLPVYFKSLVGIFLFASAAAGQYVVSDFNGTGFDWLCCGFSQQFDTTHVTLTSADGWGIADIHTSGTDVSDMVEDRFQIRVRMNEGNTAQNLSLGLVDEQGNEAKWWFDVAGQATTGGWSTLTAWRPIGEPTSGTGDWQNIDLTNITGFRVLGHWQHPGPFNMSIDQIGITSSSSYPGAAPDAPWRSVAAARIDEIRKADLRVSVTDRLGKPIPDAEVSIQMQQHEFGFGSAVQSRRLAGRTPGEDITYREKVEELFNVATLENSLKWPPWEGEWGNQFSQSVSRRAITWLDNRNIDIRGHNMIWPGSDNLSNEAQAIMSLPRPLTTSQQTQLRNLINNRILDVGQRFEDQISAWDVINEPRSNHDVMDALDIGDEAMVEWFQTARAAAPNAALYLNDYGILTSGGNTNSRNQQTYIDTLRFLKDQGAPIDGVGFQGHFREDSLTGPEQIWDILDKFDELGLDMQVTEFDFETNNETLQAQYTSDFLTAIFAHPGVDDFLMWGFYEDAHWRPEAAMFRSDWSIKPNGEAYKQLVFDEWWTNERVTTDDAGQSQVRAFKGDYRVTVTHDGREETVIASLSNDGLQLELQLDGFVSGTGDFNADGLIDAQDIDLLSEKTGTNNVDTMFDLTGDQLVDAADREALIREVIGTQSGDADLDGFVRFSDFSALASSFGESGGWADGDFDGDGFVRFVDFALLAQNYGEFESHTVAPEPSAYWLIWFASVGLAFFRKRQSTSRKTRMPR